MKVVNAILTHLGPNDVSRLFRWWRDTLGPGAEILVVYGGPEENFESLGIESSIFVPGSRHKTRDHQRERQSYNSVWKAITDWDRFGEFDFINFSEGDVVPLAGDWTEKLAELAGRDSADILCHGLNRVDMTSNPHYLHHAAEPRFHEFWRSISVRRDKEVILAMLGCHSFWRADVFSRVAAFREPFPIYLEIYLPTLAHHLGYRVRNVPGQEKFIRHHGDFAGRLEEVKKEGAWAAHPVKTI